MGRDTEQPKIQNDGMKYEGLGFRAECRLAGRLYGQPFGVDVAFAKEDTGAPITITNYDMFHAFDPSAYEAVILDESSLIKNSTGATRIALTEAGAVVVDVPSAIGETLRSLGVQAAVSPAEPARG